MQWTGCHDEERHEGDRGCGGCTGQGVMMRRDMEVTEVVKDAMDQRLWRMHWTGCHDEERHGGDRGCEGCNGPEVVEDTMDRVS